MKRMLAVVATAAFATAVRAPLLAQDRGPAPAGTFVPAVAPTVGPLPVSGAPADTPSPAGADAETPLPAPVASPASPAPIVTPSPVPPPGRPLAAPDLKALYENLRTAVNGTPLPPYVAFTLENASQQSGRKSVERLRVVVRESDDVAVVRTERLPNGTPGDATLAIVAMPAFPAATQIYRVADFPVADFGLRMATTRPGLFDAAGTPEPEPTGEAYRTLASVRVVDVPYVLTDLGQDTIRDKIVYHLGLQAKRDPGHHVLREIWIDPETFLPVRYIADRYVDDVVPFDYLVTVNAEVIDGNLIDTDADGHFVVRDASGDLTGYSHWRVTRVAFPASEPAWAFDAALSRDHAGETIPGL